MLSLLVLQSLFSIVVISDHICPDGELCSITIDDSDSCNDMINGSLASFLEYTENTNCDSTLIHCPSAGCNVNCREKESCKDTMIIYDGHKSDGSVVEIMCDGDASCGGLRANVENASFVRYITFVRILMIYAHIYAN